MCVKVINDQSCKVFFTTRLKSCMQTKTKSAPNRALPEEERVAKDEGECRRRHSYWHLDGSPREWRQHPWRMRPEPVHNLVKRLFVSHLEAIFKSWKTILRTKISKLNDRFPFFVFFFPHRPTATARPWAIARFRSPTVVWRRIWQNLGFSVLPFHRLFPSLLFHPLPFHLLSLPFLPFLHSSLPYVPHFTPCSLVHIPQRRTLFVLSTLSLSSFLHISSPPGLVITRPFTSHRLSSFLHISSLRLRV